VDLQEAFQPHIANWDRIVDRTRILIEAAKLLQLPFIVTEQYPKGLGRTVEPLRAILGDCRFHDKVAFSCPGDDSIKKEILRHQRSQVLIAGIETHVCIAQTAGDLLDLGLSPYLAVDTTGSRHERDAAVALQRMRDLGIVITTTEAAILELTGSSKHPRFREISRLIK
jgi:nicotinamidase-related amidase